LLDNEKPNEANFLDWYHNLRIVLRQEKTEYVLSEPYPEDLPTASSAADRRAHEEWCDDAYTMIQGLHGMFENQARDKRYNISKALFVCKLVEGSLVSSHVVKMMGYIETLVMLGCKLKDDLTLTWFSNRSLRAMRFHYELSYEWHGEDHGWVAWDA
jgi:hypothetical protein